ncbi:FAD-binding domain-containing protein [Vararia minispora EC-137]|uniref:FAD-binding domain-containing protein n=1 Tax=Vararia minispora EC-137 TaxID=1314806 RepID=A0ACB8Q6Z6_9AGAM|nr:FAD-binding domain-containing protein [Vararia minispora EC-137]
MSETSPPDSFRGDWITPDHIDYDSAILRWARNSRRRAAAVAFVRDAADVVTVLAHTRSQKLPVAIRGGGHSVAGASSIEGGVVIDLSRYLNGARVDAEKRLAYVGGGALWKCVDEEGMKYGLATVGGTINHTGVGGLILGGGIGHLMGEYGHVVDNLVQVTVVTADGQILTASESESPELFWGIRGGGSNFGVVTEFVLKMHPQRATVFCGNVIYPGPALPAILAELDKWWEGGPSPRCSIIYFITLSPDGHPINILSFFYNGSEEEGREYFKPFLDIGSVIDMAQEIPYENENLKHDVNYYLKGVFTTRLRTSTAAQIQARIAELSPKIRVALTFVHELFPSKKALSFDRDSTSFVRWEGISNLASATWTGDDSLERQEEARAALYELCAIVSTAEDKLSVGENTGYGNYLDEDTTKDVNGNIKREFKSAALFGDHYPRLQALKKKYDPEMMFNKWNTIVPA